ncbi:MAG: PAS domain-containing protein [Rhodospirillaceae bacterium]|jgi:hypothetical protein|nr:PAS domain-containing protein [Rhodospirillaceae bacterium]MBT4689767.1 PAS domain-containing protein [Rhodospirillaceae bacterium]MBT5080141.1 PAS domain-containing protein [Rhodospirillaceae bacterium]MBT5526403.1 PAS domain-containing protein [Rhodospirillaceae bacterium]MBT5877941.1 PAS domain-containing protein [Rhodospirillaceae bacterium]
MSKEERINPIWPSQIVDELKFELDRDLNCEDPMIVAALDVWDQARGNRDMPSRKDLDPLTMPPSLLQHVLLVDVEHQPQLRFRWRLIGTHITTRLGRDSTGRYWDELYSPAVYEAMSLSVHWVIRERRPLRSLGFAPVEERKHLASESVDLPLSEDGKEITMIMIASVYK